MAAVTICIIPPSPSSTESKRPFYTSVSLFLSCIQGYHYYLSIRTPTQDQRAPVSRPQAPVQTRPVTPVPLHPLQASGVRPRRHARRCFSHWSFVPSGQAERPSGLRPSHPAFGSLLGPSSARSDRGPTALTSGHCAPGLGPQPRRLPRAGTES